jgi:hypothetical protein
MPFEEKDLVIKQKRAQLIRCSYSGLAICQWARPQANIFGTSNIRPDNEIKKNPVSCVTINPSGVSAIIYLS